MAVRFEGLLAGIGQPRHQAAAHFFVRNELHSAGINVLDSAVDLFCPSLLNALVERGRFEAFEQCISDRCARISRQGQGLLQDCGSFFSHDDILHRRNSVDELGDGLEESWSQDKNTKGTQAALKGL